VTLAPLPDGTTAIMLAPNGVDIKPTEDGGYHVQPVVNTPEPVKLEDKLRKYVKQGLAGLQSKLRDAVQILQDVVAGFIKGIFSFFFTLMIGAFILIDLEKVHKFLRSLFPPNTREDYDVIIAGIDRGLSGVIRGQLLICLINGGLTYVGLLVFGVKYKLILATVAALMSLIPIFGSILSSVPIVIAALTSGDEGTRHLRAVPRRGELRPRRRAARGADPVGDRGRVHVPVSQDVEGRAEEDRRSGERRGAVAADGAMKRTHVRAVGWQC
jgi:hypothetical protein